MAEKQATLRFELGGNQHTLRQLLWNLQNRSTVQGRITVEIDGEVQGWWEKEQDEMEERFRRWRQEEEKRQAEHEAMFAAITKHSEKSDEEIAELVGIPVSWVPARRQAAGWWQQSIEKRKEMEEAT
jgi:hypothetical protein